MRALHLLYTLLDEDTSVVRGILTKYFQIDVDNLLKEVLEEIVKLPRIL